LTRAKFPLVIIDLPENFFYKAVALSRQGKKMTGTITDKYTGDDVADMADAFYDDKHWLQAYTLYRTLSCADNGELAELETRMAICCAEMGRNDKALKHFQAAYELDKADVTGFQNYIYHLGIDGKYDAVIAICTDAMKDELLSKNTAYMAVAHVMRGNSLRAQGSPHQALADLTRGLQLGFDDAEGTVACAIGGILMDEGSYAAAIPYFNNVPVESEAYAFANNEIAVCHDNIGNPAKAIVRYTEAVTFAPDNGFIRRNLYAALVRQGDWSGALIHADYFVATMLPTQPNYIEVVRQKAICLRELGHYEAAESLLKECLELEQTNYRLQSSLAKVFYECGDIVAGARHASMAFAGAVHVGDDEFAEGVRDHLLQAASEAGITPPSPFGA
jgi:tetratricopeptide (TPR) repeat protein